jgi:hypothetical protein
MQRWAITGILILIVVLGIGTLRTTPPQHDAGYAIIFDKMPNVSDERIFFSNEPIGKIQSRHEGAVGVVKLVVDLNADFLDQLGNNIAFYPEHGRLTADKLQTTGEALSKDAVLCGFTSKAAFNWFKFKTILSNRISAAGRRAQALMKESGLS